MLRQFIVGLLLIIIGSLTLLELLGIVAIFDFWHILAPTLVIVLGLYLVTRANYY